MVSYLAWLTAPESSSFLGSGICTAGLGLAVGPATCWMYLSWAARASVALAICRSFMLLPRAIWWMTAPSQGRKLGKQRNQIAIAVIQMKN